MCLLRTAAVVLTRHQRMLEQTCGGDYLFHSDENAAYNLGQKSWPTCRLFKSMVKLESDWQQSFFR